MKYLKCLTLLLLMPALSWAQASSTAVEDSGFLLTDYALLEEFDGPGDSRGYLADGTIEALRNYHAIIVDQPSLIVDPDSKYKVMKPDTMSLIADKLQETFIEGLGEQYQVVNEAADGVLYARTALSHLYIEKPKRGLLGYTPIGAAAHAVKSGGDSFVDKNTLVEMTLEVELLDSKSGDILIALVIRHGQRKDKKQDIKAEPATWNDLFHVLEGLGSRLGCRLDNARQPVDQRTDCVAAIPLEPTAE